MATTIEGDVLNLEGAAQFCKVDEATVRRWCHDGLPHFPVSGSPTGRGPCEMLVLRAELVEWLRLRMVRLGKPEPEPAPPPGKRGPGRPRGNGLTTGGRPWPKP